MQHRQPPWDRGWERVPVHTVLGTMVAILPQHIQAVLGSLGPPCSAHGCTCRSALRCWSAGGTVHTREAQEGETPWVGALPVPQSPKGVMVGRQWRAELLRLSRWE